MIFGRTPDQQGPEMALPVKVLNNVHFVWRAGEDKLHLTVPAKQVDRSGTGHHTLVVAATAPNIDPFAVPAYCFDEVTVVERIDDLRLPRMRAAAGSVDFQRGDRHEFVSLFPEVYVDRPLLRAVGHGKIFP